MSKIRPAGAALAAVMLLTVAAAPAAVAKGRPQVQWMLCDLVSPSSSRNTGKPSRLLTICPALLKAELTGAAEVPSAGDLDGTGYAKFRLNKGKRRICYKIRVNDIEPATAAHIHTGAVGVAGSVVVTLGTPDASGYVEGCVNGVERSLIKAIRKHRADYYVNVHNADFEGGALRGQLKKWAPGRKR